MIRGAGLGVLALVAAWCGGCGDSSAPAAPSAAPGPPPPPEAQVTIISPEYQVRMTSLETSAKVQFNEEALVRVHAPLTGRVREVLARPGDAVDAGQRLFVLESPDLGSAKADYAKAVADVERSERALTLARELFEMKAIAEKEIREADNDNRKAVAERERAAARLRALGVSPDQLTNVANRTDASTTLVVRAPRSGVVVERNVTPGQVVAYGTSDQPVNLFVIADLSTMWVVADVYEPDIPKVRRNQAVVVTLPCCPGERYEGRVAYISDSVDPQSRTVKVRAVVPNRDRALKAEMFVRARIDTGSQRVLVIPQNALHLAEGNTFVLVETSKNQYARRPVKLGADLGGAVEVLEGVGPGDRVVANGSILLKRDVQ